MAFFRPETFNLNVKMYNWMFFAVIHLWLLKLDLYIVEFVCTRGCWRTEMLSSKRKLSINIWIEFLYFWGLCTVLFLELGIVKWRLSGDIVKFYWFWHLRIIFNGNFSPQKVFLNLFFLQSVFKQSIYVSRKEKVAKIKPQNIPLA